MQLIAQRKNQRSIRENQGQVARQPAERVVIERLILGPRDSVVGGSAIEKPALIPSGSS